MTVIRALLPPDYCAIPPIELHYDCYGFKGRYLGKHFEIIINKHKHKIEEFSAPLMPEKIVKCLKYQLFKYEKIQIPC
jgi:hypothetical protein